MPTYLPAGLTQYVLSNFSNKSPPYHVTQDEVSIPLQRLEVGKITRHQSVRGRGGVMAVMYETHWTGLSRPSWEREMDLQLFHTRYCATGTSLRVSTAKPTICTAGCELVLHNGNFLGVTASDSWRPVMAAFLERNGLATTVQWCFPTEPAFGTRATTVCGDLGISARARLRMGYIFLHFLDYPGPIKLPLAPARHTPSTGAVRGSWCLHVHVASAFVRGIQRNVDESRGAAVDS